MNSLRHHWFQCQAETNWMLGGWGVSRRNLESSCQVNKPRLFKTSGSCLGINSSSHWKRCFLSGSNTQFCSQTFGLIIMPTFILTPSISSLPVLLLPAIANVSEHLVCVFCYLLIGFFFFLIVIGVWGQGIFLCIPVEWTVLIWSPRITTDDLTYRHEDESTAD